MAYKKEYSWSDVKKLVADSEARASPFTLAGISTKPTGFGPLVLPDKPAAPRLLPQEPLEADFHGHASSMHHSFTDEQLVQRGAETRVAGTASVAPQPGPRRA